ncbi:hypothetical protein RSAG8_12426, partial [Rhizoctonia solani AG-8 WAC10335]
MSRGFMVWQVVPNVAASIIAMPQQCVFDRRITRHKLRMHYVCPDWRRDRQIASAGSIRISISSCSSCARCWISDVGGLFLPSKVCMQLDAQVAAATTLCLAVSEHSTSLPADATSNPSNPSQTTLMRIDEPLISPPRPQSNPLHIP